MQSSHRLNTLSNAVRRTLGASPCAVLGLAAIVSVCTAGMSPQAQAQQVYAGASSSGLLIGGSLGTTAQTSLRAEYSLLPTMERTRTIDGLAFNAELKAARFAVIGDYYPFASTSLRLTSGLAYNDYKLSLRAAPQVASINGKNFDLNNAQYDLNIEFPAVTPYVAVGFGHKASSSRGFSAFGEVGVHAGRLRARSFTQGILGLPSESGAPITQGDIDAKTNRINQELNRLSVLPSVSFGISYGF